MRMNELTIVAPLPSPEKPPATNYAAVRSFPLSVSLTRGPLSSVAAAEAGAQRGPRRVLGRASALRGPPFPRAGPTSVKWFPYLFCLFCFHRFVCMIQKYIFPSW